MDPTADFYSRPSYDFRGGGGFPVFSGSRRQRGGGFLGTLKSFFRPIAKTLGKALLTSGIGFATKVAADAASGKGIKRSFMQHGKEHAVDLGRTAAKQGVNVLTNMIGKGSRRAPRKRLYRKALKKRKHHRRSISRKRRAPSRKRRAPSKSIRKRKAKKRRVTVNF
jgi:hypothetical protein